MEDMIALLRQSYIEKIEHHLGKNMIIILTGQRRVGKSCVLRLFKDKISENKENNIVYIDKEKYMFDDIRTYHDLNAYIDEHRDPQKMNYILVDEIQDIEGFEKSIRSYYEEPDVEIIITGSNSSMLSSDLSNKIGGRYKEIYVQSLSYEEFMTFHNLSDSDETVSKYIQFGGLPGLIRYGLDEEDAREYQMDVFNAVLLKDVIKRNQIRNVPFLENLIRFLADNVGKIISANSIAKYMKSQGETITSAAVINYMKTLCDSYILHRVNRYDIHGKRLFESNDKFYFEDNGIRNVLVGGRREGDIEKVIENVIYNHLIRLGYEVTVGQLQAGEIDFVCNKPDGQRAYVQASYIIIDDATQKREFGNLRAIKDNYPKYVLTTDFLIQKRNGIIHANIAEFIKNNLHFNQI